MKALRLIIFAALVGGSGMAYAQFAADAIRIVQDETGVGSRATAMGGAYAGLADDYSALYWNPSGLAFVKKSQFFAELTNLSYRSEASFVGELSEDSQNYTRLRSLGFAMPLPTRRGSFALGVGYNRIKDFDSNLYFGGFNDQNNGLQIELDGTPFEFDEGVAQTEEISEEGGLDQWSVGFGMLASPHFAFGVTASVVSGKSDYNFSFLQQDTQNNFENRIVFVNDPPPNDTTDFDSYQLDRTLETEYTGLSLKIGGLFRLAPGVKLGGAIGLPTTYTVNEISAGGDVIVYDDGVEDAVDFETTEFEYDVKTPFFFDAGASFSNKQVTLAAGMRYRDWSQTRFEVNGTQLANSDLVELRRENELIRDTYRSTVDYHFGGEIAAPGGRSAVRVGYAVYPDPRDGMPDEFDKRFMSLGLGFAVDRNVRLDLTYLRGSWEQESEDDLTPGGTSEEIQTNKFSIGFTYNFR